MTWFMFAGTTPVVKVIVEETGSFCLARRFLHVPCPGCGILTGLTAIVHGDFSHAYGINPAAFVVATCIVAQPLLACVLRHRRDALTLAFAAGEQYAKSTDAEVATRVSEVVAKSDGATVAQAANSVFSQDEDAYRRWRNESYR